MLILPECKAGQVPAMLRRLEPITVDLNGEKVPSPLRSRLGGVPAEALRRRNCSPKLTARSMKTRKIDEILLPAAVIA